MNKSYMVKLIVSVFLILSFASIANAETMNTTLIEIHNIDKKYEKEIKNNILTQVVTLDDTDRITKIKVTLDAYNISNLYNYKTAIRMNFSNNISFTVIQNPYKVFWVIPHREIRMFAFYKNYTLFSKNQTFLNTIPSNIIIDIKYDYTTSNSTFEITTGTHSAFTGLVYSTKEYVGMPSNNILFDGLSKFDLKILVEDIGYKTGFAEQKESLGVITKTIYKILTVGGLYESELLLNILKLFDTLFTIISVIFQLIFIYPYILILYIITIGNFYCSWKSNTPKEVLINMQIYYKAVGIVIYNVMLKLYELIINFIRMIRQLFQI